MYINCHSFYSLRYGTLSLEHLVALASQHKVKSLALTDINTLYGIYDFVKLCKQANITPIIGMEFREQNELRYIVLAKNELGIAEINKFRTAYNKSKAPLPLIAPDFQNCLVIYPLVNAPKQLKAKEFIGIHPTQTNLLYQSKWSILAQKMVVLQTVNHSTLQEYELHKILRAIDLNTILSKLSPNDVAYANDTFISESTLIDYFGNYPIILENTQYLLAECSYSFTFTKPRNKRHYTTDKQTDMKLLRELAYKGMQSIYGNDNIKVLNRIDKELAVIEQLNFSGYFLITWDIIQYSNSQGFMHIGRGSGANSIVGYCLGITNVCPLELDLYFERFLNENRKSPPDFDIDWSWRERNCILDYIFKKYGSDYVAFCGAISTFKYRSIIREIGKAYGLPKQELDELTRKPIEQQNKNSITYLIHQYGQVLEGFPNQRTMHPCGILISEEPITQISTLDYPPKGYGVAQFDMHIAEMIGYDKFDILSQRGIGHINDAVQLIQQNKGITVDIRHIPLSKNELNCNQFLKTGNTIGCFYIESPAMRGLLRKLKCDTYKTLVAASSIIRPGVAQSGMMQEYIFRHNNPDQFNYFHPVFQEQLDETYGIMVYQEDVIKIALHYGGLPAADGDILRRAMSGKTRSKTVLDDVKNSFLTHCQQKGHPKALSEEIYRQIESFAGYSFCKAHSASYAIESYQSLYLKVHYPLEFITAVINNQGGFYQTEIYIHEAKRAGAIVLPPCINNSNLESTLTDHTIYLGFKFMLGLSQELITTIITERNKRGQYSSIANFIDRITIGIDSLQKLIFIGAFQCLAKQKSELLIQARLLLVHHKPYKAPTLLQEPIQEYQFPTLSRSVYEDAFDEIELLGYCISCSPFDLLKTKFRGEFFVKDLPNQNKQTVRMLAYLITTKPVSTSRGRMYFGTWIDANGDYFDTVHFPDSLASYPFLGSGCYLLLGTVTIEYGVPSVQISKMAKLPYISDPRYYYKEQYTSSQMDINNKNKLKIPQHRRKFNVQ
ncbi:DNA polymerase III subunit alpha [Myroides pelagicus]|uniref:DNA polymerase III subunit alpha n=1 Tax=Myroides pelagicus TaxID=270914 RepID=UPI002DBBC3D9|nr:DNA polymerase III subunit alpha [Myroides pelagicus]MEC4113571.1 DNA polymerase III subunit alpha [Myroides pelagicus]